MPATLAPRTCAAEATVVVLASGSGGNCTYIGNGHHGVLVDCGISAKQVIERMKTSGLEDAPVDAVCISHEHRDHLQGARVLANRLKSRRGRGVPFFMSPGTAASCRPEFRPEGLEVIGVDDHAQLGSVTVRPFPVLHDAAEPVAWRVGLEELQVGVVTDLGKSTTLVDQELAQLHVAVLEFNHDEDMLLQGRYPWHLKQRIRSQRGHLSNTEAARLLETAFTSRLRKLFLGHLSQENNRPARALAAAAKTLQRLGMAQDVSVEPASQFAPTAVARFSLGA